MSFNGNKILTTGGGGVVLTNNKKLANKIRHLSTTAKLKHGWEFIHDTVGYNYRMPNINAALGLAQIENIKLFLKSKKKLYQKYLRTFSEHKEVFLLKNPKNSTSNNWLNTIWIKNSSLKKRNNIIRLANKKGLFLRPPWKPLNEFNHFKFFPKMNLDISQKIYLSCINLPSSAHYFLKKN